MKKKKIIIYILIIVLIHIVSLICTFQAVYMSTKNAEESKALTFYLPRSRSFASMWNYTMSEEGIIEQSAQRSYDFLSCKYDYFEFEPVQSGEVTIYFIARYETEVVEENCFSITYYVDENGNVTEVSNENKPGKINFDDDIAGLVTLKIVDGIRNICIFIFGVIFEVIEMFDFQSMNQ